MNFAISSLGRSGSKALASLLNNNNMNIQVVHEPSNEKLYRNEDLFLVSSRFVDNYGEVNSFLRNIIGNLKVDKKALIIRKPENILISALNWNSAHRRNVENLVSHIHEGLIVLDQHIQNGMKYIKFEHMILNCRCFKDLINYLELDCGTSLSKANHKDGPFSSVLELDVDISCFDWFSNKYYSNNNCF